MTPVDIKIEFTLPDGRYCEGCPCKFTLKNEDTRIEYCTLYEKESPTLMIDEPSYERPDKCIEEHGGGE